MATNIVDRSLKLCARLSTYSAEQLKFECATCYTYQLVDCDCVFCSARLDNSDPCSRDYRILLVYVDGAVPRNGYADATAGIGIVTGSTPDQRWSIPITQDIDPISPRTNQRAELLAAIYGVKVIKSEISAIDMRYARHRPKDKRPRVVLMTDSTYVQKGVTEWLPKWKANGWRGSKGKEPSNLDLFQRLDHMITTLEKAGILCGIHLIERYYNREADALAKQAARTR
ncbi:ribonuclease H-like protein [Hymenopellis radicata]|nr:ribonuclease H-like protein [Hymenopellis radicata]